MGYTTSTVHGIEVPDSSEANDVPEDIGKVVTALEGGSIIRRLTSAQIAALTGPQKPAGVYFHNTTTGKMMVSDGSTVANVDTAVYAVGRFTGTPYALAVGETVIYYDAEDDPSSILNAGTGVVTLPSAGVWSITGFISCNAMTGDSFLRIWHNSTDVALQAMTSLTYGHVAAIIKAAASDTVKMAAFNVGTSKTLNLARLSVVKIGT